MTKNPILEDLHATRRKLLEESGGTLDGLFARLHANQAKSGRTTWPTRRTNRSPEAVKQSELAVENQSSSPDERS